GIGKTPEAEAERGDVAMLLQDGEGSDGAPCSLHRHGLPGHQAVLPHDRRIFAASRRLKAVAEALVQRLRGTLINVDRDALAAVDEEPAQVVDAVGMIGMLVRVEDGLERVDLGVEELFAQIRRRVDQHPGGADGAAALDQQRGAAAPVLGILRIAVAPAGSGPRHAAGRATAENGKFQRHAANGQAVCLNLSASAVWGGTLPHSPKKIFVVCRAVSPNDTPPTSAPTAP